MSSFSLQNQALSLLTAARRACAAAAGHALGLTGTSSQRRPRRQPGRRSWMRRPCYPSRSAPTAAPARGSAPYQPPLPRQTAGGAALAQLHAPPRCPTPDPLQHSAKLFRDIGRRKQSSAVQVAVLTGIVSHVEDHVEVGLPAAGEGGHHRGEVADRERRLVHGAELGLARGAGRDHPHEASLARAAGAGAATGCGLRGGGVHDRVCRIARALSGHAPTHRRRRQLGRRVWGRGRRWWGWEGASVLQRPVPDGSNGRVSVRRKSW